MSNLRYDQLDWNRLWATPEQMRIAWTAIDTGDVESLRSCFQKHPKIYRWRRLDGYDFLDSFALANNPTAEMLRFLLTTPLFSEDEDVKANFSASLWTLCRDGGSLRAAEMLLKHAANPNHRAGEYDTPLSLAVYRNRLDLVSLLMRYGADAAWQDHDQKTPLNSAEELKYYDISNHLRNVGAPSQGKPCRIEGRKTKLKEATLTLEQVTPRLEKLFAGAVHEWIRAGGGKVRGIGVSCSGIRGFVRIAISGDSFEPYAPDCCADLPATREIRIASWSNAFARKDRICVRVGGKEKKFTNRSAFRTRDKPFFSFVRDVFLQSLKAGLFDALEPSDAVVYGCQNYYFHHCTCWDNRLKRIRVPRVWQAKGGQAGPSSGQADPQATGQPPALSESRPVLTVRKSAERVICDALHSEWLIMNGAGIQRVPFGRATPTGRIPDVGMYEIDPQQRYCLAWKHDELRFYDHRTGKTVAAAKAPTNPSPFLECHPVAMGTWLFFDQESLTRVKVDSQGKIHQTAIDMPLDRMSNFTVHPGSGLIAVNEYYSSTVYVGRICKSRFEIESELVLGDAIHDISALLDLQWHPNGFLLGMRYVLQDESCRVALTEATQLNVTADALIGINVLCADLCWSPDGRAMACQISGKKMCISAGILSTKHNLVLFEGVTLDVFGKLPVNDVACYCWSTDSRQLMVGGYQESTLWRCDVRGVADAVGSATAR